MYELKSLLIEAKALMEGHFLLTKGSHSNKYINKDAIYSYPPAFSKVVAFMYGIARDFSRYDIITGPAIAGAVLAAPIALELNKIFVYPEKDKEEKMVFRRGYDKKLKDKNVLLIEDVVTTGRSVRDTILAVDENYGTVVGVIVIWNRTNQLFDPAYTYSLIQEKVDNWMPEDCPLCKKEMPLLNPKDG